MCFGECGKDVEKNYNFCSRYETQNNNQEDQNKIRETNKGYNLVRQAEELIQKGNYNLAEVTVQKAVGIDATNPVAWMVLADIKREYQEFKEAIKAYNKALLNYCSLNK